MRLPPTCPFPPPHAPLVIFSCAILLTEFYDVTARRKLEFLPFVACGSELPFSVSLEWSQPPPLSPFPSSRPPLESPDKRQDSADWHCFINSFRLPFLSFNETSLFFLKFQGRCDFSGIPRPFPFSLPANFCKAPAEYFCFFPATQREARWRDFLTFPQSSFPILPPLFIFPALLNGAPPPPHPFFLDCGFPLFLKPPPTKIKQVSLRGLTAQFFFETNFHSGFLSALLPSGRPF